MPDAFGLAIIILLALGVGRSLGLRNGGFLAQVALWFAIGVHSGSILLIIVGCVSLF